MISRRQVSAMLLAAPFASSPGFGASNLPAARWRGAMVIDGLGVPFGPDFSLRGEEPPEQFRLPERMRSDLRNSGLTALHLTVGDVGNTADPFAGAVRGIARANQLLAANADIFLPAVSAADVRSAKRLGKVAILFGFQDTTAIGSQLDRAALFKSLGIRCVQLTYNKRNLSGDGALERSDAGLSDLGRRTIEALEAQSLLLDLSHGGRRTIAEGIAHAKRPMAISHTGCRDLYDNPRNTFDTELKSMADKGGVVGIYHMPFLTASGKPTRHDVIRHLDHAVKVCGEDHVSIGTDGYTTALVIDDKARGQQRKFYETRKAQGLAAAGEGPDVFNYVADYNSPLRFRMLAADLATIGWGWRKIEKILGGNLLRLWTEAWG